MSPGMFGRRRIRGGGMAFAGAEHRRLRRPAGGRGGRIGLCARALDAGEPGAAEGHAQARGPRRVAVCVGLPLRVPEEFSGTAQGGALSRMDLRGGEGVSGTPRLRGRLTQYVQGEDLARPAAARSWLSFALSSCAPRKRRADAAMDLGLMPSFAKPSSLHTLSTVSDL